MVKVLADYFDNAMTKFIVNNRGRRMKYCRQFVIFKPEEFENAGFRFRVDGKHYEKGAFQKR